MSIVRLMTLCAIVAASIVGWSMLSNSGFAIEPKQSRGLLLLRNGRIITGSLQQGSTGYVINKPNGRLVIPIEDVKLVARDLNEAYQKQKNAMKSPDPIAHVELARWCLNNGLYDATKDQLEGALKLNPGYEPAKRMLDRLQRALDARASNNRAETNSTVSQKPSPPTNSAGSLQGLSHQTVREFTRVFQPLLMNRCANASCHGPYSPNTFRLARVRLGRRSNRILLQRNLVAVLKHVDTQKASNSKLLDVFDQPRHRQELVFAGRLGAQQFKTLQDWVKRASRELRKDDPIVGTSATKKNTQVSTNSKPTRSKKDAFDPSVFNRQRK